MGGRRGSPSPGGCKAEDRKVKKKKKKTTCVRKKTGGGGEREDGCNGNELSYSRYKRI